MNKLFTIGCSHLEAPIEIRERLSIDPSLAQQIYDDLHKNDGLAELLILNTCNRTEIYGVGKSAVVKEYLSEQLSLRLGTPPAQLSHLFFQKDEIESITHALRVASGLESQILGEPEILGQVKQAYRIASEQKSLGKQLNHLFQKSFQVSKWCRSNTSIGTGMVSIGNIIVDLAQRVFGNLENSSVLLISAGEVTESAAKALRSRANPQITITNRTEDKAHQLAEELGCASLPFAAFREKIFRHDIIVSSTSAPGLILTKEDIRQAVAKRKGQPLILIDVAIPRDIEESAGDLSNVYLYNMDDLAEITKKNLQEREKAAELCREYIEDKALAIAKKLGK